MRRDGERIVLRKQGFEPVSRAGSHVKLRYENDDTGETRVVTVPMHDEVHIGTRRNGARQAGAQDVRAFCDWVEENR